MCKTIGGQGWADVWLRGHFGWEYKKKRKNLDEAYQQLLLYREDLENPPLLVVCDLDRFEIHTNFTGTAKRVYAFDLAAPENLNTLRKAFTNPEALRPGTDLRHDYAAGGGRVRTAGRRALRYSATNVYCPMSNRQLAPSRSLRVLRRPG